MIIKPMKRAVTLFLGTVAGRAGLLALSLLSSAALQAQSLQYRGMHFDPGGGIVAYLSEVQDPAFPNSLVPRVEVASFGHRYVDESKGITYKGKTYYPHSFREKGGLSAEFNAVKIISLRITFWIGGTSCDHTPTVTGVYTEGQSHGYYVCSRLKTSGVKMSIVDRKVHAIHDVKGINELQEKIDQYLKEEAEEKERERKEAEEQKRKAEEERKRKEAEERKLKMVEAGKEKKEEEKTVSKTTSTTTKPNVPGSYAGTDNTSQFNAYERQQRQIEQQQARTQQQLNTLNKAHNNFNNSIDRIFSDNIARKQAERAREEREEAAREREIERRNEEIRREAEERKRLAEEARLKAEAEKLRVAKLAESRTGAYETLSTAKFPTSMTKSQGNKLWYFVYTSIFDLKEDRPTVYVSNVFAIGQYPDSTWPLQITVQNEVRKLIPSSAPQFAGFFNSEGDARAAMEIFKRGLYNASVNISEIYYAGKNATAQPQQNTANAPALDFWGNPVKKTAAQPATKQTKTQKLDYWGNPIKE